MTEWSRRSLLRVSAGAAVAVPMAALGSSIASAGTPRITPDNADYTGGLTADEPVMFCIHDAEAR